jgi:hypothetical protein
MKKMNNYEAPVAEVIELSVSKDFMQGVSGSTMVNSSNNTPYNP